MNVPRIPGKVIIRNLIKKTEIDKKSSAIKLKKTHTKNTMTG